MPIEIFLKFLIVNIKFGINSSHNVEIDTTPELVSNVYLKLKENIVNIEM